MSQVVSELFIVLGGVTTTTIPPKKKRTYKYINKLLIWSPCSVSSDRFKIYLKVKVPSYVKDGAELLVSGESVNMFRGNILRIQKTVKWLTQVIIRAVFMWWSNRLKWDKLNHIVCTGGAWGGAATPLEGVAGKERVTFFRGGCNFHQKIKISNI